jgi:antibiotic biosynthesis monooxygenase (ABM) superfamily enzyme
MFAHQRHAISLGELRLGFVLLAGAFFILNVYRQRRLRREIRGYSEARREALLGSTLPKMIRKLQIAVVVLPVLLVFGVLMTNGAPLAPRLVGITINLCLTFWFIALIRRAKKKLSQQTHVENSGMQTE